MKVQKFTTMEKEKQKKHYVEKARPGLVAKKVTVTRGGSTFLQTVWINPNKEIAPGEDMMRFGSKGGPVVRIVKSSIGDKTILGETPFHEVEHVLGGVRVSHKDPSASREYGLSMASQNSKTGQITRLSISAANARDASMIAQALEKGANVVNHYGGPDAFYEKLIQAKYKQAKQEIEQPEKTRSEETLKWLTGRRR